MSNLISIMAEKMNKLSTPDRATSDNAIKSALSDYVSSTSTNRIYNTANITNTSTSSSNAVLVSDTDSRVRLKAQTTDVYGSGIMSILKDTNGLLFPYTPSIQVSQDVNYTQMNMTHSNTDYYSYMNTPNVSISISGKFSVQNQREGKYALAVLHFLRTASKMYFGETDAAAGKAGLPPPILLLSGYGTYIFNNIRVILKGHNYSFEDSVDMVPIALGSGTAKLPALFNISINLTVQQTPSAHRTEFSLDSFRNGSLLERGGWI